MQQLGMVGFGVFISLHFILGIVNAGFAVDASACESFVLFCDTPMESVSSALKKDPPFSGNLLNLPFKLGGYTIAALEFVIRLFIFDYAMLQSDGAISGALGKILQVFGAALAGTMVAALVIKVIQSRFG